MKCPGVAWGGMVMLEIDSYITVKKMSNQAIQTHVCFHCLKGKFTQKLSWPEIKESTKRRRAHLTVCKYLFWFSRYFVLKFQISLHGGLHDSHFFNRNEAELTSQLQYQNQEEVISLDNSGIQDHGHFKFSVMIVFLSSSQNKLITLLPWQPKNITALLIWQLKQLL